MFLLSRLQGPLFVAAGALVALAAAGPAQADPQANLGPVGPHEPILASVGNKRVVAFYVPERGECTVNAVVFDEADSGGPYASSRVRVTLRPGEMFHLDGVKQESIDLLCGADAKTLAVVNRREVMTRSASKIGD